MGCVQGLGEFLPISSSAHLVVLPWFVRFQDPGLGFSVALHFGTLLAVVVYFWQDWWQILKGSTAYVIQRKSNEKSWFFVLVALVLATVPAALAGPFLDEWAETTFRHPLLVAAAMIVFGLLLFAADRLKHHLEGLKNITHKMAVLIGLSQCLALVPGVSRSGVTITVAMALGVNRADAARFSFLMATPIVLGACVFKYKYFFASLTNPDFLIGVTTSAVFGFLSIKYLLKLVREHSYAVFVWYRILFGVGVVLFYFLNKG